MTCAALGRTWTHIIWVVGAAIAVKVAACTAAYELMGAPALPSFLGPLAHRWDAVIYLMLARFGYHVYANVYAFSPLFPAMLRLVGAGWWSPLIVSNAAALAAVAVLVPLMGWRAAMFFALFPTWVSVSTFGYSESVYVLCMASGFWLYRSATLGRVTPLAAGALVAAAVTGRYVAGPAVLTMTAAAKAPWQPRLLFLMPLVAAAVGIVAWQWIAAGTPFAYFRDERAGWNVAVAWPWQQATWFLYGPASGFWMLRGDPQPWIWLLRHYVFVAISAFGCWVLWRDGARDLAVFSAATVVAVLCTVGTVSGIRLLLAGFPAIAAIGNLVIRRPAVAVVYAMVSVAISTIMIIQHLTSFFA